MSPATRCLPAVALVLGTALSAGAAHAQDYRPDSEAYPCGSRPGLAIVQDAAGFTIQPHDDRRLADAITNGQVVAASAVNIGAALKIDLTIFKAAIRHALEAAHASHR